MAYHDGELSASDRSRVEEHLLACSPCRGLLAGFRGADSACQVPSPPEGYFDDLTRRVMDRVGREPAPRPSRSREHPALLLPGRRWMVWAPAASLALVLVAAAGLLLDIQVSIRPRGSAPVPQAGDGGGMRAGPTVRDLLEANLAGGELVLVQVLNIRPNGDTWEFKALKSDLARSGLLERSQRLRSAVSPVGDPELTSVLDDLVKALGDLETASPEGLPLIQERIRHSGILERAADYKALLKEGGRVL